MSLPTWRRFPRPLVALTLAANLAAPVLARASDDADAVAEKAGTPRLADISQLSAHARAQIDALVRDKRSWSPAQRKISSSLLYSTTSKGSLLAQGGHALKPVVPSRKDGLVAVDIGTTATKGVAAAVRSLGGKVLYGNANGRLVRALVPSRSLERLASRADVRSVRPAVQATTDGIVRQRTSERLREAVASLAAGGSVTSEGDKAHRAEDARQFFGLNGAGIKVGVLSDSDDFKEDSIASGDLPANTITLPGQDGRPGSGEGTAMMEIVHDIAPGAQIYFATAFNSPESFADNIRALREAGCDIIVDDVIYYFESPFQDDIVAKAVQDVIADGAMYFSSAGNSGGINNGTSGVWEGDFKKAKGTIPALDGIGYEIHEFGHGVMSNRIELGSGPLYLHWSDPGSLDNPQSGNDYDLLVMDPTLNEVLAAAFDVQDGDDLPFEYLGLFVPSELRIVLVKFSGEARALRVTLSRGELALATTGAVYGHNSAPGAFAVAAVDSFNAGGGAFTGGATNPVEIFSSDGPRRVFYDSSGTPYKPGKFTFKQGGAQSRPKPDFSAADGVSTTLPGDSGLNPFFGTSAAAPHAAAIAALLKSSKPGLTPAKIKTALIGAALDIEAPGKDRDSGVGILDAYGSLAKLKAKPAPFLEFSEATAAESVGDGDGFVEPGESASLTTELTNLGGAAPVALNGVLTTSTPGVTVTAGASAFPAIAPGGGTGTNATPYGFSLAADAVCGLAADFTLTASYTNGVLSPQALEFQVATGKPGSTPATTAYSGPDVDIPDADSAGVDVPLNVSGATGAIANLVFSIDGTACSTDADSATVGLAHTWTGDIVLKLTSPSGTTVTLINRAGGGLNDGVNFCQTVLDDAAVDSIQAVAPEDAPYTGTWKPANPLSAFNGEDPNGTWTVNVSDNAFFDTGVLRAFSLAITPTICD